MHRVACIFKILRCFTHALAHMHTYTRCVGIFWKSTNFVSVLYACRKRFVCAFCQQDSKQADQTTAAGSVESQVRNMWTHVCGDWTVAWSILNMMSGFFSPIGPLQHWISIAVVCWGTLVQWLFTGWPGEDSAFCPEGHLLPPNPAGQEGLGVPEEWALLAKATWKGVLCDLLQWSLDTIWPQHPRWSFCYRIWGKILPSHNGQGQRTHENPRHAQVMSTIWKGVQHGYFSALLKRERGKRQ